MTSSSGCSCDRDAGSAQTCFTYDGLGSITDLTDGTANPTDAHSYHLFGSIRSQARSSPNAWLFTNE